MTQCIINETGISEIRTILVENHKLGSELSDAMILAWVADAQFQLDAGNSASIEIKARDHVSGFTQDFNLSTKAFDTEMLGIDE